MNNNAYQSAFPYLEETYFDEQKVGSQSYEGLTKREYFAAIALQGVLSNTTGIVDSDDLNQLSPIGKLRLISQIAVDAADALMERLTVTGG